MCPDPNLLRDQINGYSHHFGHGLTFSFSIAQSDYEESMKLKVEKMYIYFKKQKLIRIGIGPVTEHIPDTSHIFFSFLRPV